jgi:hypothetical protein
MRAEGLSRSRVEEEGERERVVPPPRPPRDLLLAPSSIASLSHLAEEERVEASVTGEPVWVGRRGGIDDRSIERKRGGDG